MPDFQRVPVNNWTQRGAKPAPAGALEFVMYAAARRTRPDGTVSYLLWLAPNSADEPAKPELAVVYSGVSSHVERTLVAFHIPVDGRVHDFQPPCLVRVGRRKGLLVLS